MLRLRMLTAFAATLSALAPLAAAPSARQAAVAPPDPGAAARAALARPINAGSIPFLLPHSRYSNVAGRLAEALRDERTDVRAVAARTISVSAGKVYDGAVAVALDVERDPLAGAEVVRAFMAIRGPAADADAIAAAKRLGRLAINAVIVTMAHTRPLDVLPHLVDFDLDSAALADTLLRAVAADAPRVARALDALPAEVDLAALPAMFSRAGEIGLALPAAIVEPSLRRVPARRAAFVYLLDRPPAEVPARLAALGATPASQAIEAWDDVLLELIARGSRSVERRDLRAAIAALERGSAPTGFWRSPALSRLAPEELSGIQAQVLGRAGDPSAVPGAAAGLRPPDRRWREKGVWRSVDPLPGLDAAVAAAANCRPGASEVGVMQITYGPRGQVRAVQLAASSGSAACREATAMLAMLEIAPIGDVSPLDRTDHVVAVFTREALECEGRASRAQRTRSADSDPGIVAPRKLRDVRPVYPKELMAARVQGAVVVEAVIERSGCVSRAAVVEPAHPALNAAALVAVAQWRYAPTLLNGEPVAVIMRMTSNFSLK